MEEHYYHHILNYHILNLAAFNNSFLLDCENFDSFIPLLN